MPNSCLSWFYACSVFPRVEPCLVFSWDVLWWLCVFLIKVTKKIRTNLPKTSAQKNSFSIQPRVSCWLSQCLGEEYNCCLWENSFQCENLWLNQVQKCFWKAIAPVIWEEAQCLVPNKDRWHWRGCCFNYNNMVMAFSGRDLTEFWLQTFLFSQHLNSCQRVFINRLFGYSICRLRLCYHCFTALLSLSSLSWKDEPNRFGQNQCLRLEGKKANDERQPVLQLCIREQGKNHSPQDHQLQ